MVRYILLGYINRIQKRETTAEENIFLKKKKKKKTYRVVDGLPAIHIANNDIIKLAKSVNKCAASVAIARLLDKTPPIFAYIQ